MRVEREIKIMDKKVTGILAYISWLGWLIAFLAGDKEGAKFHLNQALVLNICSLAVGIVFGVLSIFIPFMGYISSICSLVLFIFFILGLISAIKEEEKELPLIGSIKILK